MRHFRNRLPVDVSTQWCSNPASSHWTGGVHKASGTHTWNSVTVPPGAVLTIDETAVNGTAITTLLTGLNLEVI